MNLRPTNSISADRVQASIRSRFSPTPTLTPATLNLYLDLFRRGFFRDIAIAWDAIERRDYNVQVVAAKRKKSVARHGWEVLTLDDSPAAQQQKLALDYFYNHLTTTNVLEENETGGLPLLIRQMMDALGKRYAVHEIVWQPGASLYHGGNSATFQPSLTASFRFCPLWWFEGTQGRLRFLPTEFALYGVEMDPAGWLVSVGDGIMEACSIAYLFKNLPLRDWLNCSEKFGTPAIIGRTDAQPGSDDWNHFADAIAQFGQDWAAIFSRNNAIELVEAKMTGEGPFAPLVEKMDRAITTLWRGADLGTMSAHNAAGASLQADESDLLELDDAQWIGDTLNTQVSRQVLNYYFGDAHALAYLKIRVSDKKQLEQSLKVDQFLLDSGVPLAIADALERYDRPTPTAGAPLLKPIAAAPSTSTSL